MMKCFLRVVSLSSGLSQEVGGNGPVGLLEAGVERCSWRFVAGHGKYLISREIKSMLTNRNRSERGKRGGDQAERRAAEETSA